MDTKKELADFVSNNNIIGVTAGVTIALVSKDVILSLVQDVIIPIIVILLIRMKIKSLTQILPNKDNSLNITKFIGCLITWVLALICTFIFVQYAFVKILGASSKGQKHDGQAASTF
jgi:large-conductance mechanosensitive channel